MFPFHLVLTKNEFLSQPYPKLRLFEFWIYLVFFKRNYGEQAIQSLRKIYYIFFNVSYTASQILNELL